MLPYPEPADDVVEPLHCVVVVVALVGVVLGVVYTSCSWDPAPG